MATSAALAAIRCSCSTSSATSNAVRSGLALRTAPMAGAVFWTRSSHGIATESSGATSGAMPPSPRQESTSIWRPRASATLSGFPPTARCRDVSLTYCAAPRGAPDGGPALRRQLQLPGWKTRNGITGCARIGPLAGFSVRKGPPGGSQLIGLPARIGQRNFPSRFCCTFFAP